MHACVCVLTTTSQSMVRSCSRILEQLGRIVSFLFVGCFVLFAETELNESLATSLKDSLVLFNVLGDYIFFFSFFFSHIPSHLSAQAA